MNLAQQMKQKAYKYWHYQTFETIIEQIEKEAQKGKYNLLLKCHGIRNDGLEKLRENGFKVTSRSDSNFYLIEWDV